MNTDTYTYLLAHSQNLSKSQLEELARVIEEYPYFQSARALQLKGYKNEHSFLYNDALKLTAAYTTDRDVLFEYITSESFVQNKISEMILQQSEAVKEIEVEIEDVSEHISLEIDRQLKAEMKKAEAILSPKLFERKAIPPVQIASKTPKSSSQTEETAAKQSIEETSLNRNEPLPFTQNDTHSFGEWLKLTKATPINRSAQESNPEIDLRQPNLEAQEDKDRKFQLIEKFIQDRPKLTPQTTISKSENLAKPYTQAPDTLMTETLAKVYLQQKNYKKAIKAYEILILKNPEKSGFFADQIRAIQKLIKTEEQ